MEPEGISLMLNQVVFAPMAERRVTTATGVNPGFFSS
jgi:hypothetical protein